MHCFYECLFLTSRFILSVVDDRIEQHVCVKLSKSAIKTTEMLHEAFRKYLSWTMVFEWHSHFKASRVSVEDDEHSR
jgi:uncharacterized cysteine cluster protein YcgN (CxxCxxCC family)